MKNERRNSIRFSWKRVARYSNATGAQPVDIPFVSQPSVLQVQRAVLMLLSLLVLPCESWAVVTAAADTLRLSLDDCLELAVTEGTAGRNARLDVVAALAQREETRSLFFPSVKGQAMGFQALSPFIDLGLDDLLGNSDAAHTLRYYLETEGGLYDVNTAFQSLHRGYSASLWLTQPVYAGGRIVTAGRLAEVGLKAARQKEAQTLRDSRMAVEEKYSLAVSLQEKQQAVSDGLQLLDTLSAEVEAAVQAGLALPSDGMKVALKRDALVADSLRLAGGLRLAQLDLQSALGLPLTACVVATDRFEATQAPDHYFVPADVAARRCSERQLLDLSVQAKTLDRRMVIGEALPEVAVGAAYGYGKLIGDSRANGAVFATVSVPLTDWYATSRKRARADCALQQAENDRAQLTQQLELRVLKAWEDLSVAWKQVEVASHSVATAQTLFRQAETDYRAGMITTAQLLEMQTQLTTSRSTLAERQCDYQTALMHYRLFTE